ncbi:nitroreductase family protein [Bifidobacterium sp. ESL0732]|uniref:nitroreductase family protein n=1 Tax=Bifidobacterium sp. ESL0732 TaxID=2983222 RepID=UPI0023FA3B3F|nr:nitroreductase family protein [Bifidobacterium sp. ESL0732]WEV63989.1 hypothetical protein OZX70_08735 [Bifidobacterium sp. ESL0732]
MDLNEAMTERHSVRMYSDEPVSKALLDDVAAEVERCNASSGLHFQMASGLEDAFCGYKTHYGRFSGVHNAIALVTKIDVPYDLHPAKKAPAAKTNPTSNVAQSHTAMSADLHVNSSVNHAGQADNSATQPNDPIPPEEAEIEEKVGYYGEQLALKLVQLGLATSWAVLDDAATGWWELEPGERVVWVLAFGHPARPGAKHHSKPLDSLCSLPASLGGNGEVPTLADAPEWFQRGVAAASLAPTSLSQQPFHFTLEEADSTVNSKSLSTSDPAAQAKGIPDQNAANDSHSAAAVNSMASSGNLLPTVSARVTPGLFAHVGLGCAKRNFEIGAGSSNFTWAK